VLIPKLDLRAEIIPVGLEENGNMASPEGKDEVGWFEPGVKPGQKGNAVLAGHLDTEEGIDAIFSQISTLQQGDRIVIEDSHGHSNEFAVESIQVYATEEAPLETIFGSSSERRLNLITCHGKWNETSQTYDERLVVYAVQEDLTTKK
jgi:LPXTG-site transpeptidase (sortase) family protein